MVNEENLVPNSQRSPEELREMTQKGGKASGEARRKQKSIREALQGILSGKYEMDGKRVSGYEALAITAFRAALEGNVQAFKEIRDTIGEKPVSGVSLESGDETMKEIKIAFVDKSKTNTKREQDPKIVGEYTPPTNTEAGKG